MEVEKETGNVRIPSAAIQTSRGDNSAIDVMKANPLMPAVAEVIQVSSPE